MSSIKHTRTNGQPSRAYVFVVLALAAFMLLFVIWRSPGITYRVQAEVVSAIEANEQGDLAQIGSQTSQQLLDTDFILAALKRAELIRGETTPQMRSIAEGIGQRLNLRWGETSDAKPTIQLALETQNPQAAVQLLDCMTMQSADVVNSSMLAVPATLVSQRGGSVKQNQLAILLMLSSVAGLAGVWLADRAKPTPVLYSEQEVQEVVGLLVLVRLENDHVSPIGTRSVYRRRLFRLFLAAAECGVVAVLALIVLQFATQDAFFSRFCTDPLAAYGEALSRVIG